METQGKQATMCKKMLFLAWNETWLQFFVVYTGKNIAFPICVWVQVFKPVALFQKWQWPFFTVTQTTLSGVSCAHGHKGKAAKCEVWPIMAYAHSGPMYLAFWPRRPAGCWFTSTARTVGVITKTYAVYKYKHRSDINTCQPEPQKGSNSLIKVSFLIKTKTKMWMVEKLQRVQYNCTVAEKSVRGGFVSQTAQPMTFDQQVQPGWRRQINN